MFFFYFFSFLSKKNKLIAFNKFDQICMKKKYLLKNIRGDRNELSPTFERKLPKVQSPSSFSNGQKYSSVPAIVKLSTPEPFSYKPTVPVTQRFSSTFSSSTTRSYSSTKFPQTFPTTITTTTTQRTTTQEPPQYYPTRYFLFFLYNKSSVTCPGGL